MVEAGLRKLWSGLGLAAAITLAPQARAEDEKKPAPPPAAPPAAAAPAPAAEAGTGSTDAPKKKPPPPPKKKPAKKPTVEKKDEPLEAARAESLGVAFKGGVASFSGDFSNDKNQTSFGLMIMGFPNDESKLRAKGGLADKYLLGFEVRTLLDFEFSSAKQDGIFELVAAGQKAEVTLIAVDAQLCALADLPVQVCPTIGFGHMLVNDAGDYDASFGVIPYGVIIAYKNSGLFGAVGLLAGLQVQFYSVTQTVEGLTARADVGSVGVFAGVSL